jgi:hypothetical protein
MLMHEDKWDVSFIPWENFLEIMLLGDKDGRWGKLLLETELIVGGLNYEGDFLYVVQKLLPF